MTFEIGLTSFADTPLDASGSPSPDHGTRLRNIVEEVARADAVGLDVYGLGEHHRPDMAASVPVVTLAAAAGVTDRIRLSSAVVVLSSADPVRTYQDYATLDRLSAGRAELMVGRGSFIESFPLYGYSLEDYESLFVEKLDLLLELRASERISWSGKHRAPLHDVGVYPRSEQDPLPVWIAVGGTPTSVVRAGQLGLPLALAIIGGDPARFRPLVDLYRRSLAEHGHDPDAIPLAVHAHGVVGDDDDEIADLVWPSYSASMNRIGRERGWPPMTRGQFDAMRGPNGNLVLGNVETVATKIAHWRELLGIDRFMLHGAGSIPHDAMLHSIDLLGGEVAPVVRAG